MATSLFSGERPSWTWADLVSTYRFWGLAAFFVFSGLASTSPIYAISILRDRYGLSVNDVGAFLSMRTASLVPAFFVAWAAIRTNPKRVLLTLAGIQVLAAAMVAFGWSHNMAALMFEFGFIYLADAVVQFIFPAVIASAMGGGEVFFAAFGVLLLVRQFQYAIIPLLHQAVAPSLGHVDLMTASSVLGLICLAPVKQTLFSVPPPPRGRSLEPIYRGPVAAGILSAFVPFYFLYWSFRAHGEAAHLEPSRSLLSPRAGIWIWFGVPGPIILAALADHLNRRAAAWDIRACRTWKIIIWGVFLLPVAIGLLQGLLNRLSAYQQSQAARGMTA